MIRRLTASVFAITFGFLICVLLLGAGFVAGSANNTLKDEAESVCLLSAQRLDSEAFANNEERVYLTRSAASLGMVLHVFSPDGDVLYASRLQSDPLTQDELDTVLRDSSANFVRRHGTFDGKWIYSCRVLADGTILRVSRSAETVSSVLGFRIIPFILLALVLSGALAATVYFYYYRIRRPMLSMADVLTAFADGQLDARVRQDLAVNPEDVAQFNQLLGRLQDRVFRQTTRNHALSAVMNSMQSGMIAIDADMRILIITPTAKMLLGVKGNPEGMDISQASHDVDISPLLQEAMQQDGVYTNTVAARTSQGRGKRPLRLYITPMRKDGELEGAVAMVEDITELRRLEEVRTSFAANVSHELKTPLTSIRGYVDTLQNGAINNPETADRFLRIISMETDRLTRLINDILSISKIESGEMDNLPKERIDLRHMAQEVCEMLRIQASHKDVTIVMNAAKEPCFILGNPDRVRQVLINLIENAIKYNKDGGTVTVGLTVTGDSVNFTCSDTGIGIPQEHLPRIFERFYRVDKGRSRSMGGTGLGLSIVKHIVTSLGGMIEVHSEFGQGTEFLVTLPRVEADTTEEHSVQDDPFEDDGFTVDLSADDQTVDV